MRTTQRALKLAHFLGLCLFLGSIVSFIVISTLAEGAGMSQLAFGRRVISAGTRAMTLPGMWLLAASGLALGLQRYGWRSGFFRLKAGLMLAILLNAHGFVMPAVSEATELAQQAAQTGQLSAAYAQAYGRETICGALNIMLCLAAAATGVWRPRPLEAGKD